MRFSHGWGKKAETSRVAQPVSNLTGKLSSRNSTTPVTGVVALKCRRMSGLVLRSLGHLGDVVTACDAGTVCDVVTALPLARLAVAIGVSAISRLRLPVCQRLMLHALNRRESPLRLPESH